MTATDDLQAARGRAIAAIDEFEQAMRDVQALIAGTPPVLLDQRCLGEVAAVSGRANGLMTAFLRDRPGLLEDVMADDPSREKWRQDIPAGRNVETAGRLDPAVLRDCRVVLTLSPAGGKLSVIAGERPVLTLRLPPGPAGEADAAALVLGLVHDYAAVCDAAADKEGE